jgi:hypothetical protein
MSGIVRLNKQDALIDCQALLKNKEVLKWKRKKLLY